ncbi:MAG: carbonic anhydrase [Flavobacteriaceae bacterium TMED171]|nr:carbonic anhydrase [Flavobacteriaceae bacterium]OUW31288.1 MAG: carbonic anhydrase [Flavobacteriaceae bacterium TMED171]|tara:strand:+ start:1876 stop:2508 length:633 start_codon:yes stop_codon:yes gene_type:complete
MNKNKILSKERQDDLTSMDAFNLMVEGNLRYIDAQSEGIDLSSLRNDSVNGQNPHSIVLSCIDSRVVVEQVFDQALGDIFVARVAGNFANTDIVASMEYACAVAGSKLIIVLGHEACGAVKAACDKVELGNITSLLSNITPAVDQVKGSVSSPHDSSNTTFVNAAIEENVNQTIDQIRSTSPILKELEDKGQIQFKGGVYKLASGKVEWI